MAQAMITERAKPTVVGQGDRKPHQFGDSLRSWSVFL